MLPKFFYHVPFVMLLDQNSPVVDVKKDKVLFYLFEPITRHNLTDTFVTKEFTIRPVVINVW